MSIPGQASSFGIVKAAQARGDFDVLAERGRRALRIHLRGDLKAGLAKLDAANPARSELKELPMQIGMIGLGRMGANIVRRLMQTAAIRPSSTTKPEGRCRACQEGATGAAIA